MSRMLEVPEVAKMLKLCDASVRKLIRDGRLAAVRIGKNYRIRPEDVAAITGEKVLADATADTAA